MEKELLKLLTKVKGFISYRAIVNLLDLNQSANSIYKLQSLLDELVVKELILRQEIMIDIGSNSIEVHFYAIRATYAEYLS